MNDDSMIYFGGQVKAMDGGKVGGYGVLFSGPEDPDVERDYFTKSTNFFIDSGDQRPILYRHGMHPMIKSEMLGKATLTIDDAGVFLEGEITDRFKYKKQIMELIKRGDLGWSSGSMSHLVSKSPNGKSFEITTWPIGEISLTTRPVDGRTLALSLKSLEDEPDDLESMLKAVEQEQFDEQFSIEGIPSIKAFCEAVSPTSMKNGTERSKAAVDATKEFNTVGKLLGEGFHSYTSRLVRRTENRFLKEGREIHPATVQQVDQLLSQIGQIEVAFSSVKEALQGIKNISNMSIAEQKALDTRTRSALLNFCRIVGKTPEEISI